MTISYLIDMSSSTFCGIHRLLFRWRGSIWKSIYPELLVWLGSYSAMSLSYRYLMNETQRILFEDICVFFFTYSDYIPITFMLGFYVTAVFNRWHDVFDCLGWIDSPALLIATYVRGSSEEMRNVRRNIIRYMVLVQALVFRDISTAVQKRFPTMDHLVTSGLMTTNELQEFDSITSPHIKFWTPIQWAFLLLRRCRDKGIIESDMIYVDILDIRAFRLSVLTLTLYDWVPMPLVYTQVVNIAVRTYFIIALFARQYMIGDRELPNKHNIDLFLPIMTILQFLFYIGWMKVAEIMINPLGEDDDDFETNWVIDRNLQVGFCIVDNGYGRVPIVERDAFWDQNCPEPLYTAEAADRNAHGYVGSCSDAAAQEDALLLQPRKRRLMSTVALPPSLSEIQELESGISGGENGSVVQVQNHNPTRRKSVCIGPTWQSAPGEGGQEGSLFGNIREIGRKLSKSVRFDGVSPLSSQGASSSPQLTEESPRGRDINGSVQKGGDEKDDGRLGRFSTIVEETESNANSRRGSAAAVKDVYTIPSISMNTSEAQRRSDETTVRVKGRRTAYETASSSSSSGSLSSMDDETKR